MQSPGPQTEGKAKAYLRYFLWLYWDKQDAKIMLELQGKCKNAVKSFKILS